MMKINSFMVKGKKLTTRNALIGTGVVLVLLVVIVVLFKRGSRGDKYETVVIDRGDIIEKITATGTINPVITVRVGSQVSGRIARIYADFNSQVTQGQIIAQLETDIYQSRVEQAEANYKMAQSQREEARVTFVDAENNLKRIRNLREGLVASERDLEIAETKCDAAKSSLSAAHAREEQARATLNAAKYDLEHTTIYSPVDGVVISRNCDVGQTVVANFQTPDLFLIAQDLTKMQVEAYVDEADIGKVQIGQQVQFTIDAFPERAFKGKVSQVRFAPKEAQNVVTYTTVVEVDNPDLTLRPGMTAAVSIIADEKKNALRAANIALRFKADPADKDLLVHENNKDEESTGNEHPGSVRHKLWVIDAQEKVKRVPIEVGISDGRVTEIVGGAVGEGERIIVGYLSKGKGSTSSESSGFRFGFRR